MSASLWISFVAANAEVTERRNIKKAKKKRDVYRKEGPPWRSVAGSGQPSSGSGSGQNFLALPESSFLNGQD